MTAGPPAVHICPDGLDSFIASSDAPSWRARLATSKHELLFASRAPASSPENMHVCIKVPAPGTANRAEYELCESRESWVGHVLGPGGLYVGRPKNDGGWYQSPTVKRGSIFANPYHLNEYSLDESLRRFRHLIEKRIATTATVEEVISLLPPSQQVLAERRYTAGATNEKVGKSLTHLQLETVGDAFREKLRLLHGRKLGCFCDTESPCHAKVLCKLAESLASTGSGQGADVLDGAIQDGASVRKRKRLD